MDTNFGTEIVTYYVSFVSKSGRVTDHCWVVLIKCTRKLITFVHTKWFSKHGPNGYTPISIPRRPKCFSWALPQLIQSNKTNKTPFHFYFYFVRFIIKSVKIIVHFEVLETGEARSKKHAIKRGSR